MADRQRNETIETTHLLSCRVSRDAVVERYLTDKQTRWTRPTLTVAT